jgi:alcohol dehydrogenase
VFPFILRGVALLGMDSAYLPIAQRRRLWARLATDLRPRDLAERVTEIALEEVETALDAIRRGDARGRWVVRVGAPAV